MSAEYLDHPAVIAYRNHFKLCPNAGRRRDMAVSVNDLNLWQQVLETWGYQKDGKWISFSPLSVGKMVSEYERRERENKQTNAADRLQSGSNEKDSQAGIPARLDRGVSDMREGAGVRFRGNRETLEQVVTRALWSQDRVED